MTPKSEKTKIEYETRIQNVIHHIETHYSESISNETLAEIALFSPYHFHRVFKEVTGETIGDFIKRVRLEKASHILLYQPTLSIAEIALQCGFSSPGTFARSFKEYFSISATDFRIEHQQKEHIKFRHPFLKHYSPDDYNGHGQIWDMIESLDGRMYFANSHNGILEYDGTSWKNKPIPRAGTIRSFAIDKNGRVYVGGAGEIGYLEEVNNETHYVSLVPKLPEAERRFSDVWQILAVSDGVYFRTYKTIFRLFNGEFTLLKTDTFFSRAVPLRDTILMLQKDVGLVKLHSDKITLTTVGEKFLSQNIIVYFLLPYDEHRLLVFSKDHGHFLCDEKDYSPFPTEADPFLSDHPIYKAAVLGKGLMALGTSEGGLVIIDKQGKIKYQLNKNNSLEDNTIRSLYMDKHDALWIGLNNGITKVELSNPIFNYSESSGFEGTVNSITRHQGKLYLASSLGVFQESPDYKGSDSLFRKIPEIKAQPLCMLSMGESLLIGTNSYIYELHDGSVRVIESEVNNLCLSASFNFPTSVYAATGNGVYYMEYINDKCFSRRILPEIQGKVKSLYEDKKGRLWVSANVGEVFMIDFLTKDLDHANIRQFTPHEGLPDAGILVTHLGQEIYFLADKGIYHFDEINQCIVEDLTFGDFFRDKIVYHMIQDYKENVWLTAGIRQEVYLASRGSDGVYHLEETSLLHPHNIRINTVFPEKDGLVWLGGSNHLLCYDPN